MSNMSISDPLTALLELKKITHHEFCIYTLFAMDQRGRDYVDYKVNELFFYEQPGFHDFPTALYYLEGQRSVIKEIKSVIQRVNNKLKELNNDGSSAN